MSIIEQIANDIYEKYALDEKAATKRTHLGASVIGDKCVRHIFYEYRWYQSEVPEGRILRLFDTGKREEERVIKNLKDLGFKFLKSANNNQFEFRDKSGHIGGSVDGIIEYFPAKYGNIKGNVILEIKTHSDKNFKKFAKEKVQSAFPKHYYQMQYYMGSMDTQYALYAAVNKNTDEMYYELVPFDNVTYLSLKETAESVVNSDALPGKLSQNPTWFECKMCKFYGICHKDKPADVNCRTCKHSVPYMNGTFGCSLLAKALSVDDQVKGCKQHEFRE